MKKTFVCTALLGALLTAGQFAYAQQANAKQQKPAQERKIDPKKLQEIFATDRMNELDEQLTLTPEQKKKIDPIVQDEAQKLSKIQQDSSINRIEKNKQRRAISDETINKIKPILTADQLKKLENKNLTKHITMPDRSQPRVRKPQERQ